MEVARHWRLKKQRYALVGEIDPNTGKVRFPPGGVGRWHGVTPPSDQLFSPNGHKTAKDEAILEITTAATIYQA